MNYYRVRQTFLVSALLLFVLANINVPIRFTSDFSTETTRSTDNDDDGPMHLRLDYTNLERLSPVAKQIEAMQGNCNVSTEVIFKHRAYAGLGSDLHVYSTGMCKALEMSDVRLRTVGTWSYRDDETCNNINNNSNDTETNDSPMSCYFPETEPVCPNDNTSTKRQVKITNRVGYIPRDHITCPQYTQQVGGTSVIRAATTEYLFTRLSNVVIQEAERQLYRLFGKNSTTNSNNITISKQKYCIPKNLITVHIRWGDKSAEMKLVTIHNYTDSVQQILDRRKILQHEPKEVEDVNIYLSTEDPEAVEQFMSVKPMHWNVYLDQYYVEMLQYRNEVGNVYNANVQHSAKLHGRNGLIALGSLLVAMEANDFVLTTGSNWSRLMNEIRKNIIDPRCNNCTSIIDLMEGEY